MTHGLPLPVVIYLIVQELEQQVRLGRVLGAYQVLDAYQAMDDKEPVAQLVDVELHAAALALHLQPVVPPIFLPYYHCPAFYKYQIIYCQLPWTH
jgi:hypothetical protein